MSDADFYEVLGVGRSASAEEIRTAYRELVKKHHPDLFSTPTEKAEATAKLRQVNDAYKVLGNAERRRDYDKAFHRKQQTHRRAPAADTRRSFPHRRRQAESRRNRITLPKARLHIPKKWAGYSLAAATAAGVLIFAGQSEPRLTTAWILAQKVEHSPPLSMSPSTNPGDGWTRVGEYASGSECAGTLKERVRQDEREGSMTVEDEQNGTMAITVLVKKGVRQKQNTGAEGAVSSEQNDITKRVRTLECRQSQRVEMEPRFRRALRRLGQIF